MVFVYFVSLSQKEIAIVKKVRTVPVNCSSPFSRKNPYSQPYSMYGQNCCDISHNLPEQQIVKKFECCAETLTMAVKQ